MDQVRILIDRYDNVVPSDFMFNTPCVKSNVLCNQLEQTLRTYWQDHPPLDPNLILPDGKYCVFHKCKTGQVIDLKESANACRIVSVASSQGDGRRFVFMIGFTQSTLECFPDSRPGMLVYESLWHVGCSRAKQHLIMRIVENSDDVHCRVQNYIDEHTTGSSPINPAIVSNRHVKLKALIPTDGTDDFATIHDIIIAPAVDEMADCDEDEKKDDDLPPGQPVDYGHHCNRYGTMTMLFMLYSLQNDAETNQRSRDTHKAQFLMILNRIQESDCLMCYTPRFYLNILRAAKPHKKPPPPTPTLTIPLLRTNNYKDHADEVKKRMDRTREFLRSFLANPTDTTITIDHMDLLIMYFMVCVNEEGIWSDFTIMNLYDALDDNNSDNLDRAEQRTRNHYRQIDEMKCLCNDFFDQNPDMNYLFHYPIHLSFYPTDGENNSASLFQITETIPFIAYNETRIIHIDICTQFDVNRNEVHNRGIWRTFALQNMSVKLEGPTQQLSKAVEHTHAVLALNEPGPHMFSWRTETSDNAGSLISDNSNFFKGKLYEWTRRHFTPASNNLLGWFRYKWNNRGDIKCKRFIQDLVSGLNDPKHHKYAPFVTTTFETIHYETLRMKSERCRTEYLNGLVDIDGNGDAFKQIVDVEITEVINRFFDIPDDMSDEDEEEGKR